MDEEKINLVLTDICGRLPFGVITKNCRNNFDVPANLLPDVIGIKLLIAEYDLKPYLRPMSSMTEEEDEWLNDRINFSRDDEVDKIRQKWGIVMQEIYTKSSKYVFSNFTEILDWLNAHHFDYRGLIEKGLALEAPEDMYKTK